MILESIKVRAKDLNTLVEAEPPEDRSRPLEWRRSLNFIKLETKSFFVDKTLSVNDATGLSDLIWEDRPDRNSFLPEIKPAVGEKISIHAKVNLDDFPDFFYGTVEFNKEEKTFTASRESRAQALILVLSEGEPRAEDRQAFMAGSYSGNATFSQDDAALYVDVTASKGVLLDLAKAIFFEKLDKVIFTVAISSFTFEVDDFLRDWDDSRDILIHGHSTPAALQSVVIRTRTQALPERLNGPLDEDIGSNSSGREDKNLPFDYPQPPPPTKVLNVDGELLKSIKLVLWALVFTLFLVALK